MITGHGTTERPRITTQNEMERIRRYGPVESPPVNMEAFTRKKIVLVQGSFDILHVGHARVFDFAKKQGDYLIVALNTNELIMSYKGREAAVPWAYKKELIEGFRAVDEVVAAPEYSPLALLKKHDVDIYVVADEHVHTKAVEIAYMRSKGGEVAVAPRFTTFSTTAIRETLLAESLRDIKCSDK